MNEIVISTPKGKRRIGPGNSTFIVAEMSGNHNQSFDNALKIIDAAAESGVDAIKLQTYTPETMTIDCNNKYFQVNVNEAWRGKSLYKLYQEAYTPWEWQPKLKDYAESKGILLFSTPFDESAVDFLEKMNVSLYKIASFELGHTPLLKKVGSTNKPVIISRGLASIEEINLAVKTLREEGCPAIIILHCVSSYPATTEQMNISTIQNISKRFDVVSGLSDHTLGLTASITAVSLGASVVEKHFTLSRVEGGPDASFSLEPSEMKELVNSIREVEKAIGKPTYDIGEKEKENLIFKRSIFAVKDIKNGEKFTDLNIKIIRPGYGIEPKYYEHLLGKISNRDIEMGTPIKMGDL